MAKSVQKHSQFWQEEEKKINKKIKKCNKELKNAKMMQIIGIKGEDAEYRIKNLEKPKPFGTTILSSPSGLIWNDARKEIIEISGFSSQNV